MQSATADSNLHHYNDTVEVLCHTTYHVGFLSGYIATCLANGTWNVEVQDCERKCTLHVTM